MDKSKYGVHQSHCCIKHGCKYGNDDCPVVNRKIKQKYTCEWCDDDGVKSVDELEIFYLDYKGMWTELKTKLQNLTVVTDIFLDMINDIETKYKQIK